MQLIKLEIVRLGIHLIYFSIGSHLALIHDIHHIMVQFDCVQHGVKHLSGLPVRLMQRHLTAPSVFRLMYHRHVMLLPN